MTAPARIPVKERLPRGHVAAARAREVDEWYAQEEALCDVFKATGEHSFARDEHPTFICRDVWIGYYEHCEGSRRIVDRFGQRDLPCVAFREAAG